MEGIDMLSLKPAATRLVARFARSAKGNISIVAAVTFIPFCMFTSAAVDMANAVRMKAELQSATDAAVLASATALASGESDSDKTKIADDTFYANMSPKLLASLTATPETVIDFEKRSVHMHVHVETGQVLTTFLVNSLKLGVEATAVIDKGKPICMLSFNKTVDKAINIQGTADIVADGCAVHANSISNEALNQEGSASATAESFCVYGDYSGAAGAFSPSPDNNCRQEKDPLKTTVKAALAGTDLTTCISPNPSPVKNNVTLNPGVYCGGLKIQAGPTVHLNPGTYVIRNGGFIVSAGATLEGTNVTIVLAGSSSSTYFQNAGGANIDITAPTSGPFSGILMTQTEDSSPSPHENTITGGGDMKFSGIIYLPLQPLSIEGNGEIGDTANQFAIMADTIHVQGTGLLTVHLTSDYEAVGFPALPESHEKVRLAL
jgi:Flp pilus assembly protein TadG